jgi:hypothetical protein
MPSFFMRFLLPEVAFQADPLLSAPNAQASSVTTGITAQFSLMNIGSRRNAVVDDSIQ